MQLIESKTLGTAAASIEFTSIPQTFTDLVILHSLRSQDAESNGNISINGSTSDFTNRYLRGLSSSADSGSSPGRYAFTLSFSTQTANTFSNGSIYIPNYTSSAFKSISADSVNENNAADTQRFLAAVLWSNTAAITSFALSANAGNIVAGSTVSLYGITKGSDGIVTTS
jgi:hypothetical protein